MSIGIKQITQEPKAGTIFYVSDNAEKATKNKFVKGPYMYCYVRTDTGFSPVVINMDTGFEENISFDNNFCFDYVD